MLASQKNILNSGKVCQWVQLCSVSWMKYIPIITTHVGGLLCDLGKPLGCVDDEILLPELNFYGFQGKAGEWFESYLKGKVAPVHTMKAY